MVYQYIITFSRQENEQTYGTVAATFDGFLKDCIREKPSNSKEHLLAETCH